MTASSSYSGLIERLEATRPVGIRRDKSEPINPDGPEAAAALRNLEADNARKDAALNAVNEWNMAFDGLPPPTAILVSAALSGRDGG